MINTAQVGRWLGISDSAVLYNVKYRELLGQRISGPGRGEEHRVMFRPSDVRAWLKNHPPRHWRQKGPRAELSKVKQLVLPEPNPGAELATALVSLVRTIVRSELGALKGRVIFGE